MKKPSPQNVTLNNVNKNKYTASTKSITGKKNTRYIYTEKDLGEGILEISVTPTAFYKTAGMSAFY